jgi:hypothetical protein
MKALLATLILFTSLLTFGGHIAKFTNSGTIFRTGEPRTVQFIDKTQDFFGKPLQNMRYIWDFGDEGKSDKLNPIHQYNEWGMFTVDLTVIDTISNISSDYTKRINIERFRDTCSHIVYDTVNIFNTVLDTIPYFDTTHIIVIDTIYITNNHYLRVNKDVEFYNLSGQFIGIKKERLEPGFYIRVEEGITTKILVKKHKN